MAIINKIGITNGGTIQAEHVTRTINALSGVGDTTVIATGSFSGSFNGVLIGEASTAGAVNTAVAGETIDYYILLGASNAGNQPLNTDFNLLYNANSNNLKLTGSLTTSGSLNMTAAPTSNVNFSAISSSGQFVIPIYEPTSPVIGAMYFDPGSTKLKIWDGSVWQQWAPD